jgi:DNA-directed RNA polymerase subunit RPC12/RpoP
MATTIAVSCPECHKQIKAPPDLQGKKIRCKACGHVFVVKASRPAKRKPQAEEEAQVLPLDDEVLPVQEDKDALDQVKAVPARKASAPAKKKKADDDDEENSNPYGVTDTDLRTRCPHCAGELEDGQVICLECGYNTVERTRITKVVKTIEHDFWDWFLWLLPGGLCVVVVLGMIVWDILYWLLAEKMFDKDNTWYGWLLCHYGIKIWMVIVSLFFIFYAGRFAVKRLIFNYRPPEKIKK